VKFLIDMPVTPQAVAFLAELGHDAIHASVAGLATATDAEILTIARREQRIVVTADLDYPRLLAAHQTASPGIILFRGGSYSDDEMLSLLDRVLKQADGVLLAKSITVVDKNRIRRRQLPVV